MPNKYICNNCGRVIVPCHCKLSFCNGYKHTRRNKYHSIHFCNSTRYGLLQAICDILLPQVIFKTATKKVD